MRVNIEDDLILSGRLGKFARFMAWDEDKALGSLVFFYRSTQADGIVRASRETIIESVRDRFTGDVEAGAAIDAMVKARLATDLGDGHILIRGNAAHVERVRIMRSTAIAGGVARTKAAARDGQGRLIPAVSLPSACRQLAGGKGAGPASLAESSAPELLNSLTPVCEEERAGIIADLAATADALVAAGTHTPKPYGDMEKEPDKAPRMRVGTMELLALETEHAEAMVKLNRPKPTKWGNPQKDDAAEIMLRRPNDYRAVFANFRADTREYYTKIRWQPKVLLADIDQHTVAPKATGPPKRLVTYVAPEPMSEEQRAKSDAARKAALKGIV